MTAASEMAWECIGTAGVYTAWSREAESATIYNVTKGGQPPSPGTGGYPNLESLLRLKGMEMSEFAPETGGSPQP